jgi:hypothetical protein
VYWSDEEFTDLASKLKILIIPQMVNNGGSGGFICRGMLMFVLENNIMTQCSAEMMEGRIYKKYAI